MRQRFVLVLLLCGFAIACRTGIDPMTPRDMDPTTLLWYTHPADQWDNALPVGNGRVGAMVYGRTDTEKIHFNEETYWSGGPYSQTVEGGYQALPEIQRLIFAGEYVKAHKLFGRNLMGYPIEQQKYQSLGELTLEFSQKEEVTRYRHQLDLDTAVATTRYEQGGVSYTREVFVTPVDQAVVIRLTASRPGSLSFTARMRAFRNNAHSNYATDYYRMDTSGDDGLVISGKSADYLGVTGSLRYEGRMRAFPEGGSLRVEGTDLIVAGADAVTLYIAAATSFVDYRDVSADPHKRVDAVLSVLEGKPYSDVKTDHMREHQRLFGRVSLDLGSTRISFLPTDERLEHFDSTNDPNLAALCFQFGRYLLISSSRPGTQPANLQGIWNEDMNPSWDSKYTTNINTEMNYWPAEVGNLSECAEPLFTMIRELTDQGSDVAREHYGVRGWVFHQNTDIWRVAAPMDGPDWGTFTAGGAWLCTHLWEHYLFTGDRDFLKDVYPILRGCAQFFLDFLVEHPRYGWLVTNPSTSPENFPGWPGNDPFLDETCDYMTPGTTICAGSTIDMQLLRDLFEYVAEAAGILEIDLEFARSVLQTRERLAPMRIGKSGVLQEWLEDWPQKEGSHRHISHLYGLYPGNQISARTTPDLAEGCRVVLVQRGLRGNGWASAWKMACWARLYDPDMALANLDYTIHHYTYQNLFSICSRALQIDGTFGLSAAVAELLLQSHEQQLHLLPALPESWASGEIRGLRARGGFEVDMLWEKGRLSRATLKSLLGNACRIRVTGLVSVFCQGTEIPVRQPADGVVEFETEAGLEYELKGR
ncbi:MAG: glycoside hydrolase family 95 protein [Candidatus Aminicenantaceae bacterium]